MDNDALNAFIVERNRALSELDMDWARQRMPGASDEVCLMSMHKSRYACTQIAPELRHVSAEWLRERGLAGADGNPLLPAGELPE
jgi:hypothetical protein